MSHQTKIEGLVDRDVSWMFFNRRILQEAGRADVPLLERLAFLGIYSNNLDEFFRVRMAWLSRTAAGKPSSAECRNARAALRRIAGLNAEYAEVFDATVRGLNAELRAAGIFVVNEREITEGQERFVRRYFRERLNGHISPVWFSAVKTFGTETDASIYLAVKLSRTSGAPDYAYIEIPVGLSGRFVRLPDCGGRHYVMYADDVVRSCLPIVFEGLGYTAFSAYAFKFTRDAEMEIDSDPRNGKLEKIARGIKSRKRGEPLRVIYDGAMPKDVLRRVLRMLDLDSWDTLQKSGRYQNHKDLMRFPDCGMLNLRYPPREPILRKSLSGTGSVIEGIQEADRFLHVPYHSFDSYIRVLQEAAISRNVREVKITLYRLAAESKVIEALIAAARNGKQVTVVIELMARFDEESNIRWSRALQEAGIRVKFGVEGLKVHSKITYISMKRGRSIACISTGNFHEGNARMYTDCILMTGNRRIVKEVHDVFRLIEYPYLPVRFRELLVSPTEMRGKFVKLIDNETRNAKAGKPAYIKAKLNHVTDPRLIARLYEASRQGVRIGLLVRGNCSIVPGIKGVSEHISIVGIVDRYLEHSRIFVFANGGSERVFMGSADWMPRNLDRRIEVVTPVYDESIKKELCRIVDYGLKDNAAGRTVDGRGGLRFNAGEDARPFRSQDALYGEYARENV